MFNNLNRNPTCKPSITTYIRHYIGNAQIFDNPATIQYSNPLKGMLYLKFIHLYKAIYNLPTSPVNTVPRKRQ